MIESVTPIADFLGKLHSHSIYDLGWIVTELESVGWPETQGPSPLAPYGMTNAETFQAIQNRGLGGDLNPEQYPGQKLITAYTVSRVVCDSLGLTHGHYLGRGRIHDAAIDAIRDWEKKQAAKVSANA